MIPVRACFTFKRKRGSRLQHYEDRVSFRKFNNVKRYVKLRILPLRCGSIGILTFWFSFFGISLGRGKGVLSTQILKKKTRHELCGLVDTIRIINDSVMKERMFKMPWCPYWFKIILDASYHIYFYQNQQIIRYPCRTGAFCSLFHFIKHILFSCTTLLVLWYSRLGPSCSYKFGENFDSSKTCPSIDSFQTL